MDNYNVFFFFLFIFMVNPASAEIVLKVFMTSCMDLTAFVHFKILLIIVYFSLSCHRWHLVYVIRIGLHFTR